LFFVLQLYGEVDTQKRRLALEAALQGVLHDPSVQKLPLVQEFLAGSDASLPDGETSGLPAAVGPPAPSVAQSEAFDRYPADASNVDNMQYQSMTMSSLSPSVIGSQPLGPGAGSQPGRLTSPHQPSTMNTGYAQAPPAPMQAQPMSQPQTAFCELNGMMLKVGIQMTVEQALLPGIEHVCADVLVHEMETAAQGTFSSLRIAVLERSDEGIPLFEIEGALRFAGVGRLCSGVLNCFVAATVHGLDREAPLLFPDPTACKC
jgi:hypothetical protein